MRISLLVAALLAASSARAQSFPSADPVIMRMYRVGMDSSQTPTLVAGQAAAGMEGADQFRRPRAPRRRRQ
jgi:hypothetical protein